MCYSSYRVRVPIPVVNKLAFLQIDGIDPAFAFYLERVHFCAAKAFAVEFYVRSL